MSSLCPTKCDAYLESEKKNLLQDYEHAFSNQIVKNFLNKNTNYEIFVHAVSVPSEENEGRLNQSFQQYYTELRFIHYMSQVIWRYAKDFKAKKNTDQMHYVLLMDQPLRGEMNSQTFGGQLPDTSSSEEMIHEKNSHLLEQIEDPYLYKGLQQLTKKQLSVLNLYFVYQLTHVEIALLSEVSQQAVTKMIGQALQKLRVHFEKRDAHGSNILD